jgi:hypothetical protein
VVALDRRLATDRLRRSVWRIIAHPNSNADAHSDTNPDTYSDTDEWGVAE